MNKKTRKRLLDVVEIFFVSASIVLLSFLFLAQPIVVTGASMHPNFKDKERLIVEKVTIKFEKLKRGEVVVIKHPQKENVFLIKRVVGLPNETIIIVDGKVHVNSSELNEVYLEDGTVTKALGFGETKLGNSEYFLLGDNRENSADSRAWGPVDFRNIVGRSFFVYYPLRSVRFSY